MWECAHCGYRRPRDPTSDTPPKANQALGELTVDVATKGDLATRCVMAMGELSTYAPTTISTDVEGVVKVIVEKMQFNHKLREEVAQLNAQLQGLQHQLQRQTEGRRSATVLGTPMNEVGEVARGGPQIRNVRDSDYLVAFGGVASLVGKSTEQPSCVVSTVADMMKTLEAAREALTNEIITTNKLKAQLSAVSKKEMNAKRRRHGEAYGKKAAR